MTLINNNILMIEANDNIKLWIGLGFLAALVIFFMIAFFAKNNISRPRYTILQILAALMAGFAGWFLAGEALFEIAGELSSGLNLAVTGTSGIALFFVIWFVFPKYQAEAPDDAFHFSVAEGSTFVSVIRQIVRVENALSELIDFTDEEKTLSLDAHELHESSALIALQKLRFLNENLPMYTVSLRENVYTVTKN